MDFYLKSNISIFQKERDRESDWSSKSIIKGWIKKHVFDIVLYVSENLRVLVRNFLACYIDQIWLRWWLDLHIYIVLMMMNLFWCGLYVLCVC